MNIGISRPSSPEEACAVLEAAQRHGFQGVQLKENQYRGTGMTAAGFTATYPGLTHLVAGGLIAYPPADLGAWPAHLQPILAFAGAVGAQHVCICAGVPAGDRSAERYREAAQTLTATGHAARACGVQISLHNHAGCLFETEEDLARIAENLDPAVVGLTIDTGHCAKGGIRDIPALIRRFRPYLLNVHLKDMDSSGAFCPLGRGTVNLAPVIATLRELGYDRWLIVDEESKTVPVNEAFAIARDYLRSQGVMS